MTSNRERYLRPGQTFMMKIFFEISLFLQKATSTMSDWGLLSIFPHSVDIQENTIYSILEYFMQYIQGDWCLATLTKIGFNHRRSSRRFQKKNKKNKKKIGLLFLRSPIGCLITYLCWLSPFNCSLFSRKSSITKIFDRGSRLDSDHRSLRLIPTANDV